MRSIVRRDTGAGYDEFLTELAQQSGIATPTREDLSRLDRKRKKKASNEEWVSPTDPDAGITKMKDGTTHLAYKAEHAVDMETGAVIAVTAQAGHEGDTTTIRGTLAETAENLAELIEQEAEKSPEQEPQVSLMLSQRWWPTRDTTATKRCWRLHRPKLAAIYRNRNDHCATGMVR